MSTTKNIPAAALRFDMQCEFADSNSDESGRVPITLQARTPDPIAHWFWGRIVHDMSGMQLRKEATPIDYCHMGAYDSNELIGVAADIKANNKGLTIHGDLISTRADDRASDIIAKGRAGIPFEASIDFNGPGLVLEEIGQGAKVKVNGKTFEGPGVIARKWPLRSVAVCPYGADSNTSSKFSGDKDHDVAVTFTEPVMAKTTETEVVSDPKLQAEPPAPSAVDSPQTPPVDVEAPAVKEQAEPQDVQGEIAKALAADRKRQSDIRALCNQAGMPQHADHYALSDQGYSVDDVRAELFTKLCKANASPSDPGDDQQNTQDADAAYKAEYAQGRKSFQSSGVSEDEYVASRRIDDGHDVLTVGSSAVA